MWLFSWHDFFRQYRKQSMKKLLLALTFFAALSCADNKEKAPDGQDQVPQPVETSGADVEGERAVKATVDSVDSLTRPKDSVIKK